MNVIKSTRSALIAATAGVILLFVVAEVLFQFARQSGWRVYFPDEGFDLIAVDTQGEIWAHRQYDGFVIFDGNSWKEQWISVLSVGAIAFDHAGQIWLGRGDVVEVTGGSERNSHTFQDSRITAIAEDQQQQIWVGTSNGVEVFDGESWRTESELTAAVSGTGVVDMALDSRGRLWVGWIGQNTSDCHGSSGVGEGTYASDVSMYDGKVWTSYSWKQMGLKGPYTIQAIAVDQQDQVWVGTNGGLHVLNGEQW